MDNLYPNAGDDYDAATPVSTDYKVPEADKEKRSAQAQSYPIMEQVAEWFEEQIKLSKSIDNIQLDLQAIAGTQVDRKVSIEAQVLAHQLLCTLLDAKYQEFKDFGKAVENEK